MKSIMLRALAIFTLALLCGSSQAADILFVSFHPGDDTPSAAAVTAGFTQAPDIGYTDLLRNNGHNVTRVATVNDAQTAIDPNLIAAAELIIISRSVDSSHYREDGETAFWNGLTKPVLILGGYVLRGGADGNARLGFTTGSTIPDVNSNPVRLTVNNPAHPIFAGIALDGANTMVNPYAHGVTYTGTVQRGISVNTSPIAAGGTVLATVGTVGDAAFGGMIVAEWAAGGTTGNSPPDTLGGPRLIVLTGSRENAAIAGGAAGLTSQGAGIYDLDPDGAQILLNAIDYLVPPVPATYREAVLADGPLVYFSFSDAGTTAANLGSLGAAADGTYMNGAVSGVEAPRPPQFVGFEADNVAAQLDGVDDFVQSASGVLNDLPNVTLSAWIRRAGAQRGRTGILGQNDIIEFGYIDNNTLQAWVDNFTTPVNIPTPFPDAEWDHVALVVDGANLRMTTYTNGQAAGTAPLNSATYGANANFLVVGGDAFGNGVSFNGQIDEAAVFDKALTADQIAGHYFTAVASPPIIVRQPEGTNLFEGETISLSVQAIGTPRLRYQWLYFGTELAGQTSSSLVISNAAPENTGTYAVRIQNDFGDPVESTGVDVIVNPTQPPTITQQPQSLVRYAGRTATFSVVAIGGLNLNYQWKKGADDIAGATSATLTLNNVSAADEGTYSVVVSNPAGSTPSDSVTLDVITPAPGSYEAAVVAGGPVAYWRLNETTGTKANDAWGGNDGTYSNVVQGAAGALNGDADFAADFTGNSAVRTPLSLNNTPAYTALGWMNRSGTQAARTGLWGQDGKMEFGYINDNQLQVWTDNALNVTPNPYPNGEWGFLAVVSDGTTVSLYTNGLLAGTRNHTIPANNANTFNIGGGGIFDPTGNFFLGRIDEVAVYNRALSGDDVANLYFIGSAAAPIITQQPQGTNFFQGGTLRLCVTAFGAPPLTYKWLFFGTEVAGQTGPCLEILNASPADSGTYQVEVGSPAGTVLSAEAVVDIAPANPPIITQQPQSATRYVGGSISFSGAATGSEPLSFQWQHDGADVPGATGTTLALNNLQPGNAGDYTLIAINFMGRATSAVATLTVLAPPAGSYEAAVVAGGPIAYWRLGETSGTTAFDYVGGNNGTYNNVTLGAGGAIPGDPDPAAGFDGTSSYVGTPLSLNGLSAFSMIGWIQRGADQANRTGLWGQNDKVEFGYINNNTIQLWTDNALNITPNPFPNGEWAFLAVVSDGPTVSIYTNGLLAGTRSHTIQANNANLFNIGGGGIFDVTGNFFNGLIDEVAVYNRALSAAEVDALHALTDVNECPTAADVNATVDQGSSVTFNLAGADADGDALQYSVTQAPAHGVVVVQVQTGAASYTPNAGYCGPDSFQYRVNDGTCDSAAATVSINVICNECPVANPASVTVDQNGSVNFTLTASDAENDPVQFSVTQAPAHGVVVLQVQTGAATYTPNAGYCGPDSFRFRARDSVCGESAEATVSITVNCLNLPPTDCVAGIVPEECTVTLADGTVTVLAVNGTDACVIFEGSATDPEGQPLQHAWSTNGVAFAAGPVATNCFAVGCHTVTFTSTDPAGARCSVNVDFCVITPSEAVEDCIALVDGSGVTRKNLRPLISTLKAAAASFDRGNFTAGFNQLVAFQNKVQAQIAPDNPAEAEAFIECAQRIAEAVACSGLIGGE